MFNELLESVREGGKIRRKKKAASRTFEFSDINERDPISRFKRSFDNTKKRHV